MSVSDSTLSGTTGVTGRDSERRGGDIGEDGSGVLVVGVRDFSPDSEVVDVSWPASGLGSVPVTEDDEDGNGAPAHIPTGMLDVFTLTSWIDDDGWASGMAFTGRNVIFNLRLGGVGALEMITGIGGGSCTGSNGKNAKFGFRGAVNGGGEATVGTGGSMRSSGGSDGGLMVGRVSGDAVGVGV